jgi:uncharacterized protein YbjT (DUF2867 family)
MRIILTGVTGAAGSEVLRQALANPEITRIAVLTRRAIPTALSHHPKVEEHIVDFTSYSQDLISNKLTGKVSYRLLSR